MLRRRFNPANTHTHTRMYIISENILNIFCHNPAGIRHRVDTTTTHAHSHAYAHKCMYTCTDTVPQHEHTPKHTLAQNQQTDAGSLFSICFSMKCYLFCWSAYDEGVSYAPPSPHKTILRHIIMSTSSRLARSWPVCCLFFFVCLPVCLSCFSSLFSSLSVTPSTQCKLSPVARDSLLTDIGLDTVDMMANFDGNENEPVVLPARLPVRLIDLYLFVCLFTPCSTISPCDTPILARFCMIKTLVLGLKLRPHFIPSSTSHEDILPYRSVLYCSVVFLLLLLLSLFFFLVFLDRSDCFVWWAKITNTCFRSLFV